MDGTEPPADREAALGLASRPVRYPDHYLWYVLAASLDLMVTNYLLVYKGFYEANAIADRVIDMGGFPGLIVFKFATVALVVWICEYVGAQRPRVGRGLATSAIGISATPVALGLLQLVLAS